VIFPDEAILADALLWEEGVCLDCGAVSEPLESQLRLTCCGECGEYLVVPAGLLSKIKEALEEA